MSLSDRQVIREAATHQTMDKSHALKIITIQISSSYNKLIFNRDNTRNNINLSIVKIQAVLLVATVTLNNKLVLGLECARNWLI